ncbi:enoyl-CoA hydratase [Vibrio sonorensis]|uniref:enoyl-CoA hydratase n=1 Tax=Vibrio sonorensis TaxID=1004316 RepID=UPI0008DB0833|nr:enoyl-CoA hydratase [Vibrio sonorensis]
MDTINCERRGNIAILRNNNPPANTWTLESLIELKTIVSQVEQEKNIYALVLTGCGEKFFSAGADLNAFADGSKTSASDMATAFSQAFEALSQFSGVTIAAINGYAMGGGLEAALACDIRIVEKHAKLALPEAKVGLLPCAGGTQNLTMLVGEGWAKRVILCGETLDAERALRIGLTEELVEKGESLSRAIQLADSVAGQSPVSVAACKRLIQAHRHTSHAHALVSERDEFLRLFDSKDQKEGVNAFLEKRQPHWAKD